MCYKGMLTMQPSFYEDQDLIGRVILDRARTSALAGPIWCGGSDFVISPWGEFEKKGDNSADGAKEHTDPNHSNEPR
jgi:hypothetical protein